MACASSPTTVRPCAVRLQRQQDLRLQRVGVLVLVHEHVVELRADRRGEPGVAHHHVPVQQQVVVVERLLRELRLHVGAVQRREFLLPVEAPRVGDLERLAQRALRVDAMGVDAEAGVLAREAPLGLRQAEPMPLDVHQVRRVAAIEHAERRVEPEPVRVLAYQPVADRVERAGPRQSQARDHGAAAGRGRGLGHDALRTPRHLLRRAPRERQQQQAFRRHAVQQQVGDAVRKRAGLAGACARDHQHRRRAHAASRRGLPEGRGLALGVIESGEGFGAGHRRATIEPACMDIQ